MTLTQVQIRFFNKEIYSKTTNVTLTQVRIHSLGELLE
jgi:hypothetical protein